MFQRLRRAVTLAIATLVTTPATAQLDIGDELAFRVAPQAFPELNILYDWQSYPFYCTPPYRTFTNSGIGTLVVDLNDPFVLGTFSQQCVLQTDIVGPDLIVINIDSDGPNSAQVIEVTVTNIDTPVDSVQVESSFSIGTTASRVDERTIRVSIPLANLPAGDAETVVRVGFGSGTIPPPTDLNGDLVSGFLSMPELSTSNLWQSMLDVPASELDQPVRAFIPPQASCPQFYFSSPALPGLGVSSTLSGDQIEFRLTVDANYQVPRIPAAECIVSDISARIAGVTLLNAPLGSGVTASHTPHAMTLSVPSMPVAPGQAITVSIIAQVHFADPITFLTQPESQVINAGEDLSLSVAVEPSSPGTILLGRWKRDGQDLSDGPSSAGGGTVFGATTPNLFIQNATPADAGVYQYVAFDFVNVAFSDEAFIGVRAAGSSCQADLNNDGLLNIFDIQTYINNYLAGCP
ncbi:MAG: hypothetical protein D6692_05465 [Planctomycetota bacterium]|nr:MAG: hypothetical protein D6692_05465 [Planctomycetota bacterium]